MVVSPLLSAEPQRTERAPVTEWAAQSADGADRLPASALRTTGLAAAAGPEPVEAQPVPAAPALPVPAAPLYPGGEDALDLGEQAAELGIPGF